MYTKEEIEKAFLHWFSQPTTELYDFEKMNASELLVAAKEATEYIVNHADQGKGKVDSDDYVEKLKNEIEMLRKINNK